MAESNSMNRLNECLEPGGSSRAEGIERLPQKRLRTRGFWGPAADFWNGFRRPGLNCGLRLSARASCFPRSMGAQAEVVRLAGSISTSKLARPPAPGELRGSVRNARPFVWTFLPPDFPEE